MTQKQTVVDVHQSPAVVARKLSATFDTPTDKFKVGRSAEGWITVWLFEDGTPGKVYLRIVDSNPLAVGCFEALGTALSVALQHGVPLQALVDGFALGEVFPPNGPTNNTQIGDVRSVVDYVFKWLNHKFGDTPPCTTCGVVMHRHVSVFICPNCRNHATADTE